MAYISHLIRYQRSSSAKFKENELTYIAKGYWHITAASPTIAFEAAELCSQGSVRMANHILIVGGGVGGTMLANQLVGKLYPEILRDQVRITLLSNSPDHYYKPAFMYLSLIHI